MAYRNRVAREREEVFSVLSLMRREKLSLFEAAEKLGVDPRLVLRHAREALRRSASGNYFAKAVDQLSRPLKFLTEQGIIVINIRGSRNATLISDYMRAVQKYLYTGRPSVLTPFKGQRIGRHRFVTDPTIIDVLADAGELDFDSIYHFVVGGKT